MAGLNASIPLLSDTLGSVPGIGAEIIDGIGFSLAELSAIRAFPQTLTDGLGLHDVSVPSYGQVIVENLQLIESQIQNLKYNLTANDILNLTEVLTWGWGQTVTDTLGLNDAAIAQQAVTVIEELNISPTLIATAIYQKTVLETLRITDALLRFFGGEIVETLNFTDSATRTAAFAGAITDTLGLYETYTPLWVLRATITEELDFSDSQILNMIFRQEVVEGLEFSAAYLSPDGNVTTWAINTRSGAVTEYQNYAFNSFAQFGNVYVGASGAGLFELLGDDDAGADIIAAIKSGFAEWGSSKFTMFKAAYLGVRGGGNYVLKLITGDGKEYNYGINARDMRTTKIHVGKGIRTRYFAFELTSTGQDFDLDTIEFVPLVVERRV